MLTEFYSKTEILLEVAFQFRNVANIFFIRANNQESLEAALLEIATSIGHDILATRMSRIDLATIWRQYGPKDRIRAFKTWLADSSNQPNLFIVDDVDGLKHESLIKNALPREAQIIICTSRDPNIVRDLGRNSQNHQVPAMDVDEIALLITTVFQREGHDVPNTSITAEELQSIVSVVDGHPLGACRAVIYIMDVLAQTTDMSPAKEFLDMFNGSDWQSRRLFLEYKPRIGRSLMETFEVSLERVRDHYQPALRLLELLAFISRPDHSLNFRKFLGFKRPWLRDLQSKMPDYTIFEKGLAGQGENLAELEKVSLGTRPNVSSPLQIHSLWLECIRQRAGSLGRVRWMQQILIVCHGSWTHQEEDRFDILRPFVHNVLLIAARFGIDQSEIAESQGIRDWIRSFHDDAEDHSIRESFDGLRRTAPEVLTDASSLR